MEKALHRAVRIRADRRCEYCRFPEAWAALPFHLDHIIAQQHGGHTTFDNLALACCFCNRYKGPNVSGIDPDSGEIVPLFHPRQQAWDEQTNGSYRAAVELNPRGWPELARFYNRAESSAA